MWPNSFRPGHYRLEMISTFSQVVIISNPCLPVQKGLATLDWGEADT